MTNNTNNFGLGITQERTLALAGVFQACGLVQSLARQGTADKQAFDASIQSILALNANSTEAVYGGVENLHYGLSLIKAGALSSTKYEHVEVFRYVMTLIHLHGQISKDSQRFQQFAQAVEELTKQSPEHLMFECSAAYRQFISPLRPQLIVQGEEHHLQKTGTPDQVRALLLAAVRSIVLWKQKDGSRLKLIWQRGQYQRCAVGLLASAN